jgi:hypothetical protein
MRFKSRAGPSDNQGMRPLLIASLLLFSALAGASAPLPRGTKHFQLSTVRSQVDGDIQTRGLGVISTGPTYIACAGESPSVEFEQYDFAPSAGGETRLWRVWVAYRVPYARADFESLSAQMRAELGDPSEITTPTDDDPAGIHKLTWVDARTTVQIAARWPERPDPRADRMLVVWTDRKLQKLVEAQKLADRKK